MIFVTVGTHHQPFQRLLDALPAIGVDEIVVQYGAGTPPPGVSRAEAYLPFDAMLDCFRDADRVITHAGVGSILCATREGHAPLVVPRRHDLGEHVDEHQMELVSALEAHGSVIAVRELTDLPELVASAPSRGAPRENDAPKLSAAVEAALQGRPAQSNEP